MDIKKNEVIESLKIDKETKVEELRGIKNQMISGIEDVSDRLDDYNKDMISIVSQDAESKKTEVKYKYLEANNKVEMQIVDRDRTDAVGTHYDSKVAEIKTQLLNGNKVAVNGVSSDKGLDSKYVGGVKVPYRPLLWLEGGSIIDRYGLKPVEYDQAIFNNDGTFSNNKQDQFKTCSGQIVDGKYIWNGIGTTNIVQPTAQIPNAPIDIRIYKPTEINTRLRLYSNNILCGYSTHSLIANTVNFTYIENAVYSASIEIDGIGEDIFVEVNGFTFSDCKNIKNKYYANNIPTSRAGAMGFYIGLPEPGPVSMRIKTSKYQIETSPICTPWVIKDRARTDIKYRITEDFTDTYQPIIFLKIYGKIDVLKREDGVDYNNAHVLTAFSNSGFAGERHLSSFAISKINDLNTLLYEDGINCILIHNGVCYVNGTLVRCMSEIETLDGGLRDKLVHLRGTPYSMQTLIKELLLFKDNNKNIWTDEFCKRVSTYGFSSELPEDKNSTNSILVTDRDSTFKNQLYDTPEYVGFLKDQTNIIQGKLYRGIYGDKLILLYCKTSGSWVKGTELASPSLVPYTAKSIKEGVL